MKKDLVILIIYFILTSCSKSKSNANQLPVLGHTGENILACYVNGRPLIISGHKTARCFFCTGNGVEYSYSNSNTPSFFIYGEEGNTKIGFYFNYNGTPGTFNFYFDTTLVSPVQYGGFYNNGYNTTAANPGAVNVLYFDGKIVSGTFSYDAYDSGAVVHITNGKFDINSN